MKSLESENRKRGTLFTVASIIFVLACSAVLIGGISMATLADLHTSAEYVAGSGYTVYRYEGDQVTYNDFENILENYYHAVDNFLYNQDIQSLDDMGAIDYTFIDVSTEESSNSFVISDDEGPDSVVYIHDESSYQEYMDQDYSVYSSSYDAEYIGDTLYYGNATIYYSEKDLGTGYLVVESPNGTATFRLEESGFYVSYEGNPEFTFDQNLYDKYMGRLWIMEIVAVCLVPLSLIIALVYCGQKNEDGTIKMNWFDRIFPEVQIAAAAGVSCGVVLIYILMQTWFGSSEWIKGFIVRLFNNFQDVWNMLYWTSSSEWHGAYYANILQPTWILPVLSIVGSILLFAFDLLVIVSVTKKLKNHIFWRSTILGTIINKASGAVEKSTHISWKIYAGIIAFAAAVSLITFGIALTLIDGNMGVLFFLLLGLILMIVVLKIVSTQLKKYKMVREGLTEVQKGNFSYKIPEMGGGEFSRLAHSVNSITDAQSEAIRNELKSQRLRSELISNVSHDLRTPLTSMVSYVDLLKSEGLNSPNAGEYLDIISEKTDRLHKLTDDLFEAAKASSGDIPVNMEKIDLDAMASQAIAELEENLATNDVDLVYSCKAENPIVMADGNLLWRVIENLMTNVSKYALTGTRAYVDIVEAGPVGSANSDKLRLEVKNMSRESLNISASELMERFQRGDDSRNTDGSGLGLAIANDLTNLMNGRFEVYIDGDLFKATVELFKA